MTSQIRARNIVTIGTGLGSGVFYDGQLIPNFKLGHLLWKEGKDIEKYAVDLFESKRLPGI